MKKLTASIAIACSLFTAQSFAKNNVVYINENLGFNVEGYKYSQSSFPCDMDAVLVDHIVAQASKQDIEVKKLRTASQLTNANVPIIAIDVDALALGSKEHSYGTRTKNKLPSVKVTAALIKDHNDSNFATAKHSCAVMSINEYAPASTNVMDLGSNGATMCSITKKCLRDLSRDIVEWVVPQVK